MCICNYAPKVCKKFVFSIYISLKPNLFFRKTFVVIFLSDFEEIYIDFSFDIHVYQNKFLTTHLKSKYF